MSSESPEGSTDIFYLKKVYPDATSVFSAAVKPVAEIMEKCLVVLDASALLEPYEQTNKSLLPELHKKYEGLLAQSRLLVPGQAAREFARRRPEKLANLYQMAGASQGSNPSDKSNSVLSQYNGFAAVHQERQKAKASLEEYNKAVTALQQSIATSAQHDPLTKLYEEIDLSSAVMDPDFSEEEIEQDLKWRTAYPRGSKTLTRWIAG